jgi:glyoxylase-like metal-dependent hydrolase (beta-lactamase superfamily II)
VHRLAITQIDQNLHLVDLKIDGMEKTIASYVLTGKKTAIIEAGPASTCQNLISSLKELAIKPEEIAYVAVSHIHLDHAGAAGTLLDHLPKAKLIVHQRGAPHVANPDKLWAQSRQVLGNIANLYGEPEPIPQQKIIPVKDRTTFDIGDEVQLRVVETLGHASHHLAYFEMQSQGIFVGDAAGVYLKKEDVVVPTTPSPFRLDIALSSLQKLVNLKPNVLYYSHFGKANNAADRLQAYGQQLKLWAETAQEGIEKGEGIKALSNRILWKDEALQKASEFIKNHPIWSKTILYESVKGIKQFVEKRGHVLG